MTSGRDDFLSMEFADGERLELVLDVKEGLLDQPDDDADVLLLTNRRVAYLRGGEMQNGAAFAMLEDVSALEVRKPLRNIWALLWGVGALVVGFGLWQTVANGTASVLLGIAMEVTGLYLIGEWFWSGEKATVVMQAGPTQIQSPLKGSKAADDLPFFIDRVFQLKAQEKDSHGYRRPFPPRA